MSSSTVQLCLPLLEVLLVPLKTSGPGLAHTKQQPPSCQQGVPSDHLLLLPRQGKGGGAKTATVARGRRLSPLEGSRPLPLSAAQPCPLLCSGLFLSSSLPLSFPHDISHPGRVLIFVMNPSPKAGKNVGTLAQGSAGCGIQI